MDYLALYRKYRPKTFEEIVGQKHITRTLANQINGGKIAHAYLFSGSRGTGKTSMAKIFARAVNCKQPIDGSPCQKCTSCMALAQENVDILEIDAASNNKVDEVRELKEKVNIMPVYGKYRVFIIDEVHMLSDSAFNALLKTLEEPPSHVIFVLATTDVHKLPNTVLSRCLRFDFHLIPEEEIFEQLKYIFEDSKKQYEEEAVALIAKAGAGSLRDAISCAELCFSASEGKLCYDDVLVVLGAVNPNTVVQLAQSIITADIAGVLERIDELYKTGREMAVLTRDIAEYFCNLLLIKTSPNAQKILKFPQKLFDAMHAQAQEISLKRLIPIVTTFVNCEGELRYAQNTRTVLESIAVRATVGELDEIDTLKSKITNLERTVEQLLKNE